MPFQLGPVGHSRREEQDRIDGLDEAILGMARNGSVARQLGHLVAHGVCRLMGLVVVVPQMFDEAVPTPLLPRAVETADKWAAGVYGLQLGLDEPGLGDDEEVDLPLASAGQEVGVDASAQSGIPKVA